MTPSERDAFRQEVAPSDQFFVDRPNRSDPDFEAKYQEMKEKYAQ